MTRRPIKPGDADAAPVSFEEAAPADARVQPFSFATESFRPTAALPALDRLSERMARRVRDVVEPFARLKPRVAPSPVAIRRFESWRAEKPEFTSLHLYRFRPLKGGLLLAIDPEFISWLVDAFYGGNGVTQAKKAAEFTPTEERLLVRVVEALSTALTEVWSEVMPVSLQLTSRETNTAYATLVRREDPVAIARYTVSTGAFRPTAIDVVYPVSSLRAVEGELAAKMLDDGGFVGHEWRERMVAALGNVRVRARTVLARPTMKLPDLMRLAPGDIIPIDVPALIPLTVEGRIVAQGTIGEVGTRAALKIQNVTERNYS
jgi:flagellar motor switch protein FliM